MHGVYRRPFGRVERDDLGNPLGSSVAYWKHMFWIPFTRQNVEKVVQEFDYKYRDLALGHAQESGNSWYGDRLFAVKNLNEFIEAPFDDVVHANIAGFLKTEEAGGVELFQKDRQQKRKQMEVELQQFRKVGSSNGSSYSNKKS